MANAPNSEVFSQVTQLTDANPDGAILGQSAADKIAFYGKVPYAQKVPTVGLNSSYVGALSTGSGTASSFGAQISATSGTATTFLLTSVVTGTMSVGSNLANVVAEVVNTLVGLGVWKPAAA
jgi:hypothetical protein